MNKTFCDLCGDEYKNGDLSSGGFVYKSRSGVNRTIQHVEVKVSFHCGSAGEKVDCCRSCKANIAVKHLGLHAAKE